MKAIVIGLGSMGKRRIRLLCRHKEMEIVGIDSNEERRAEASEEYGIKCSRNLDECFKTHYVDCAFVCTSPLSHADIIKECLMNNLHVFTEINLVSDGYEENMRLAKDKGLVLFLSSTPLYRKEIRTIIEKVRNHSKINYIYHVGQYLPDWHPWESYSNYFISNSKTNGCREIMAIEFPWLVTAFGSIAKAHALKGRNTDLNIDYNDNYLILLEHRSGAKGVLAVDVVTRKATRRLDVYGEHIQISWGGTPDTLTEYDIEAGKERRIEIMEMSEHIEGYASFVTENPYSEEIGAFLAQVRNPFLSPAWDFVRDYELLQLIDKIEQ